MILPIKQGSIKNFDNEQVLIYKSLIEGWLSEILKGLKIMVLN